MVTIGVDPHKQTHTAAAVNPFGVEVAHRTAPARPAGNGQLLEWARALDSERVWAVEDVRNVSGSLERFLIDRGETVVRLAPQLMAGGRRGVRTRGKSDPIDALAIARAALREGVGDAADCKAGRSRARDPPSGAVSRAAFGHAHPAIERAALAAARPMARLGAACQGACAARLADQGRLPAGAGASRPPRS